MNHGLAREDAPRGYYVPSEGHPVEPHTGLPNRTPSDEGFAGNFALTASKSNLKLPNSSSGISTDRSSSDHATEAQIMAEILQKVFSNTVCLHLGITRTPSEMASDAKSVTLHILHENV